MSRYILKRLLLMIPVVVMVAVLIFTIMYFTPGDPAIIILGPNASLEQLEAKRVELGIDQPKGLRGFPSPAKPETIFDHLQMVCAPYGTKLKICGDYIEVSL